jgi:hypothetical protein
MSDQETTQVTQDNAVPPADAPQLNIQDLQNLRAVVDLALRRGAFGGAEASSVGAVFDRVNAFLNAVAPAQQDTSETPAQ